MSVLLTELGFVLFVRRCVFVPMIGVCAAWEECDGVDKHMDWNSNFGFRCHRTVIVVVRRVAAPELKCVASLKAEFAVAVTEGFG